MMPEPTINTLILVVYIGIALIYPFYRLFYKKNKNLKEW